MKPSSTRLDVQVPSVVCVTPCDETRPVSFFFPPSHPCGMFPVSLGHKERLNEYIGLLFVSVWVVSTCRFGDFGFVRRHL